MENRIRGMLWGGAVGDALGAPYEFYYNRTVPYARFIIHPIRYMSRWQGTRWIAPGQVTDDSEMTMLVAALIAETGQYDSFIAATDYIEWANSGTFMMGRNTKALFSGITAKQKARAFATYKKRYERKFGPMTLNCTTFDERGKSAQSNGSLMRCAPLAVLDPEWAVHDCKLTNPSAVNCNASQIYLSAVRACLKGGRDKGKIFEDALALCTEDVLRIALGQAKEKSDRDIKTSNKGWVAHALYAAFYAFLHFESYKNAMQWIIKQKSGDTDTNAAIAGSLIGAYMGYELLNEEEETRFNIIAVRTADSSTHDNKRPDKYHPRHLDELVAGLCKVAEKNLLGVSEKREREPEEDRGVKRLHVD